MPAHPRTIVFFHAHPDDETSGTAGSMARAADQGHRVVVAYGTNGEHGEAPADLRPTESVVDRRRSEAERSAQILGTARIGWLGYADSGMTGWDTNAAPGAFCNADLDEAAGRLVRLLDEEDADVLVCYDWHGGYGHPDHIQIHRVGHRAADLAARRPRLLETTMNRDAMRRFRQQMIAAAGDVPPDDGPGFDPDAPMDDGNPMGTPEAEIHWQVDVSPFLDRKRAAMQAHASQVTDIGFFLGMPPAIFAAAFGTEYYIEPGRAPGMRTGWPFADPAGATGAADATAAIDATGTADATRPDAPPDPVRED